jgi:hypothetical protein
MGGCKMIKHIVKLKVDNACAKEFYDFMINPDSKRYREWWPGEHLEFFIVKPGGKNHLGDLVFMDEFLGGKRRLTFYAQVIRAKEARQIVWQMKKFGLLLPAYVNLELKDSIDGLLVKHELRLGYFGFGKILDPIIKLYFNRAFRRDLERHCLIEWPRLAKYLRKSEV